MRKLLTLMVVCALFGITTKSQTVEDILSKYTQENGKMYLQPFADAFSADFNSGLFHSAKIKKKGFQLYIGVVGQLAPIADDAKYFMAYTEEGVYPQQEGPYKVPTVFGPEAVVVPIEQSGGLYEYVFPAGFDVNLMPLAMPQITIGSLFGTDFTVRFIQVDLSEDFGKVDVFGWGLRHSIDQYLDVLPLNIALGYYRQSFKVGDYMDANANVVNLQASYSIPVITFYGGLGYEKSKVHVEYVYEGADYNPDLNAPSARDKISFDFESANKLRFTVGLCINLGPVKIHGDYNVAKQNTIAFGLGVGINEK